MLNPKPEPALLAPGKDLETKKPPLELERELGPAAEPGEEADDTADFYWVPRGLAAVSAVVAFESIAAARLPVWARFQGLGGRGRFLIV